MFFLSESIEGTAQIAFNFVKQLKSNTDSATVVGLYGELGSGKTTFMKYLAEGFGVRETVQSPTFVIMKKYRIQNPESRVYNLISSELSASSFQLLIHIDAYRIEKGEEMINLGWQEIITDPKNLVCLEWPERIAEIMPEHMKIYFEHGAEESERKIKIEL